MVGWVNAYTKERVRGFFPTYDIIFEKRALFRVSGCEFADQLVAALNGAYNLGRGSKEAEMVLDQIRSKRDAVQDKEESQTPSS